MEVAKLHFAVLFFCCCLKRYVKKHTPSWKFWAWWWPSPPWHHLTLSFTRGSFPPGCVSLDGQWEHRTLLVRKDMGSWLLVFLFLRFLFFWMQTIFLSLFWICYNITSVLVFWPQRMWNLNFPARHGSHTSCIERWSLIHCIIREVPWLLFPASIPQAMGFGFFL